MKESNIEKNALFSILEKLSKKNAVKLRIITRRKAKLTIKGMEAVAGGLPERRILEIIGKQKRKLKIEDLIKGVGENGESIKNAIGWARKKGWIKIKKGEILLNFKKEPPKGIDEKLLEEIATGEEGKIIDNIDKELLDVLEVLKRRQLIKIETKSQVMIFLTQKGEELLERKIEEEITVLTREHLINKSWKEKRMKKYDVTIIPVKTYYGNMHFLSEFIDRIRGFLIQLGFREVHGSLVELEFWNFDMLYYPQDSPVRDFEKPLVLKSPTIGDITCKEKISILKELHEKRGDESIPKYLWSIEYTRRLILRTSTVPVLIRYLIYNSYKRDTIKIFCIDRSFKAIFEKYKENIETINMSVIYSHKNANVGNLIELVEMLFKDLRIKRFVIRPAYQPYTEPTLRVYVYHNKFGWIDCAKIGVMREEITRNILGINNITLIWNIDIGKLAFTYFNLEDIRDLFSKNLDKLQKRYFEV